MHIFRAIGHATRHSPQAFFALLKICEKCGLQSHPLSQVLLQTAVRIELEDKLKIMGERIKSMGEEKLLAYCQQDVLHFDGDQPILTIRYKNDDLARAITEYGKSKRRPRNLKVQDVTETLLKRRGYSRNVISKTETEWRFTGIADVMLRRASAKGRKKAGQKGEGKPDTACTARGAPKTPAPKMVRVRGLKELEPGVDREPCVDREPGSRTWRGSRTWIANLVSRPRARKRESRV
jgi:hypothetical protein